MAGFCQPPIDMNWITPKRRSPRRSAQAGYKTFFAGKWHLGSTGSLPQDHGFDINVGGYQAGSPRGGYFSPYDNPELKDGPPGEALPLRLADETVRFIQQQQDSGPFLAVLSFYSVHGPVQTTEALWAKYRQKAAHCEERLPGRSHPAGAQVQDHPIYAGMVESMDQAVGQVTAALEQCGLADRTVVIFTSDNGGVSSGDAFSTSNLPLRGGKGRQWEGGIREPFYIVAPGIASAGSTCDVPVTGADFYPTMLELAELAPNPAQHQDGQSLVPLLRGESLAPRDLYWHYPHYGNQGGEPSSIIRRDHWKLIHYWEDDRRELYNLREDPSESEDLAAAEPELAGRLDAQLIQFLAETNAQIPARDPRFDPGKHQEWLRQIQQRQKPALEKQHARFLEADWTPNADWWGSQGE